MFKIFQKKMLKNNTANLYLQSGQDEKIKQKKGKETEKKKTQKEKRKR